MLKITIRQSGRIKAPRLDNAQLTRIGREMVEEQKLRWSRGINATGNRALPLAKPYLFRKKYLKRPQHPIRDMVLSGLTKANFTLRKAINGVIRAEPTSREARKRAQRAQKYGDMIGFAGTDQVTVFKAAQREFRSWLRKAWVRVK